jgi:hypothetical protein
LKSGTAYNFRVRALNTGTTLLGTLSTPSNTVTPTGTTLAKPRRNVIRPAVAGEAGGSLTAIAKWSPPTTGGAVRGYVVRALRMSSTGTVLSTTTSAEQPSTATQLEMTLQAGNYRFTVQAVNATGAGAQSVRSNRVAAK